MPPALVRVGRQDRGGPASRWQHRLSRVELAKEDSPALAGSLHPP